MKVSTQWVVVETETQSDILTAEFGRKGQKGFRRGDPLVGCAIQRYISRRADNLQATHTSVFQTNSIDTFPFFISGARAESGMNRYQFSRTSCSTRAR